MAVKVGTVDIANAFVGTTPVTKILLGTVQVWPAASAAPTIIGSTELGSTGTANRIVTPHASTATGDLLIVAATDNNGSGATLTAPGDWTVLKAHTNAGTLGMGIWAHVRVAGETTYSFPISANANSLHTCTTIRGGNAAALINGTLGTRAGSGGTFVTTAPSITTLVANTLALLIAGERTTATEAAPPTVGNGFTQAQWSAHLAGGIESNYLASKVQVTPGAVGATSVTYPNTQATNGLAMLLGIPPA